MLKNTFFSLLIGVLGFSQSIFAFTIINQTDSEKVIRIQEAFRPHSDRPGNLAAPIPFGVPARQITIAPHCREIILLQSTPTVLLVTIITKKKNGRRTKTIEETTCHETFPFQDRFEDEFNDDWGLVIHKPIREDCFPFFNDRWILRRELEQGFGIRCLHPLLLGTITSMEELSEEVKFHFFGN